MFIIPYYIEKPVKSKVFTSWKAWVFLANGGKEVWMSEADTRRGSEADTRRGSEADTRRGSEADTRRGSEAGQSNEETQKDIVENYLIPNGFTGKTRYDKKANCLYMEISPKTDFSDLYTWSEMLKDAKDIPNEFILRPFVWIGDSPGASDEWGWREQCEKVALGNYGTIATLWDGMCS
jgi:hypothetical protein